MDHCDLIPDKLFDFALCRRTFKNSPEKNKVFNDYLMELASMASDEDWGTDNSVLRNYITHLFEKIASDYNSDPHPSDSSILYLDDKRACFNTGLYTDRYEYIYCLFEKNKAPNAKSPWFLTGFCKESANELRSIGYLPAKVHFYNDPADLIYDYRLPIRTNKDHILGDPKNIKRLPLELQDQKEQAKLPRLFDGAVMEATKKAASNYTLAVPQYYKGSIQLLLPICLTSNEPELALAIHRDAEAYSARTCLTLGMAYNNARLIVKPEAAWIKPA